jgi:mono/diheme cytochrome c family protein
VTRPLFRILTLLVIAPLPATAQESADGAALVREHCSPCHASGRGDASRNPEAPPLRAIGSRYSLDELAEMIEARRFFEQHPQMPNFRMNRQTARAIVNYLRTLQD